MTVLFLNNLGKLSWHEGFTLCSMGKGICFLNKQVSHRIPNSHI